MSKPEVPAEQKRSRKPSTELQLMAQLERIMDDAATMDFVEFQRVVKWFYARYHEQEPTCTDPADG